MGDLIVGIPLICLFAFIIYRIVVRKRSGAACSCDGCSKCGGAAAASDKKAQAAQL